MNTSASILALAHLAFFPWIAQAQTKPNGRLLIDGVPGEARIVVVEGRRLVDLDDIVRMLRATQNIRGEVVTLYLNPSNSTESTSDQTLSRDFLEAGIELVAGIREWRQGIMHSVETSPGFLDQIRGSHQRGIDVQLARAAAAASTAGDRRALDLLRNESALIRQFSDRYLERAQKLLYVSPEEIEQDPLGTQILECARGMASMSASHRFEDVLACH